jgi:hypothetical protein
MQLASSALAQSDEEQASVLFNGLMTWSACRTFEGATDADALKRAGDEILPKIISFLLKQRPELLVPLGRLLKQARDRFATQILFLRGLSAENRSVICAGIDQMMDRLP